MAYLRVILAVLPVLMSACQVATLEALPTPIPDEDLPTVIAQTVEADRLQNPSPTPTRTPLPTRTATPTVTVTPSPSPTLLPFTPVTFDLEVEPSATPHPAPDVPFAAVQILKPGGSSRVASPISVSAYLKPGAEGKIWIELYGEDGRLLVREIKISHALPGASANLYATLDYQIQAAAEVGRLVIYVKDEAGRVSALNSVDMILLSLGDADLNPASAVHENIVIQEPRLKSLVAGGTLLASGLARPTTEQPLMAELRDEQDRVVGFRQVSLSTPDANGYRAFTAEIPYKVQKLTPVRLIVYEKGGLISDMVHLSSREIKVAP